MKRGAIFVGSIMLLALGLKVNAAVPVTVQELKTLTPVETYFTGQIEPVEKANYSFIADGYLKYIVHLGQYVFSSIVDKDGKVIRKGTKLAVQESLNDVISFMKKKKDWDSLQEVKRKRGGKLLQTSDNELFQKELDLKTARRKIEHRTLYPMFSGVVTKVYQTVGTIADSNDKMVEVTRMDKMLVKMPFPGDIVNSAKEGMTVEVYPKGFDEPIKAYCTTSFNNDMLFAYVPNSLVTTLKLTPEQEKLPKAILLSPVIKLSDSYMIAGKLKVAEKYFKMKDNPLAVPVISINKDEKGSYVYVVDKADRKKMLNEPEGLVQFKVRKVYITLGDIERNYDLGVGRNVKIRAINDAGNLSINDYVVNLLPKYIGQVKDGDYVIRENIRWQFEPGDTVVVSVPAVSAPGIYVDSAAVINDAGGNSYIYLLDNGTVKLVPVQVTGRASGYNRIEGEGIKDGAKIVVLDRDGECGELWDGLTVEVSKVLPPPERITKNRVDELDYSLDEVKGTFFKKALNIPEA